MNKTICLFLLLILSGCNVIDNTEHHGEPRIFTHPETGMEYYYEVPSGVLYVNNIKSFCESLDFEGGGWYWATINDLRNLVTGCPKLEPGGICKVANDCRSEEYCYSRGNCDCEVEETEKSDDDTLKTISLLHRSDSEKSLSVIYSSTCNTCYEGADYIEYWTIYFSLSGHVSPDYSTQPPSSDIICVRKKE